ncbi:putative transcription factor interactor and regulator Znf-B family [Lupinus albus]|uniref:Putative transcription factor interactor and regulator Znf-B family n=1 Tax=Lupinus albus TaxID=3870 RepID=A0A6A4R3P5_LUPAL|nr:putative transcription factor interactor and regulator Znf-B family [Lupinus albus]
MCKGAEEMVPTRGSGSTLCELCGFKASLYCQADNAYLCRKCDKVVHEANFLALRHIRCFLCNTCQNLTRRYLIGASLEVVLPPNMISPIENLPNNSSHRNCSRMQNRYFEFL